MKTRIILFSTILFLISSCSLFQKDAFEGKWILTVKAHYIPQCGVKRFPHPKSLFSDNII